MNLLDMHNAETLKYWQQVQELKHQIQQEVT
jgi:hypothetical protein